MEDRDDHNPCLAGRAGARIGRHGLRLKNNPAFVYNSMSDGELDEGATWEARDGGAHHGLGNLICLVDINNVHADGN